MKIIFFGFFALVWLLGGHAVAAEENLEALVAQALTRNPEVAVSDARWQMLRQRAEAAGSLEDPMLMLGIQNALVSDPFNFREDPMTQKVIGISQMIPYRGKRGAKTAAAYSEAQAARWLIDERKLELAQMVRETGYRIYAVDKSIGLTEENLQLLDDLIALAETRYAVGRGSMQEILAAQVQRSKMQEMLLVQKQQRQIQQALLNELLARPQVTSVGTMPELTLVEPSLEPEALRQQALSQRPLLHSLAAQHEKSLANQRLAKLDFYPDVTISFEYMQRDRLRSGMGDVEGEDMYALTLSFNLPVQRAKRRAMVHEAASESAMVTNELRAVHNAIEGGITQRLAELELRSGQVILYREAIIPQAEQSLEASVSAYQVGKLEFSMVLDQQMGLFGYQIDYHKMLADYHMSLAQLRTLVGGEL
ncbi:MAG: TolC family protein [Desulfuromonadales bacterium]|nr:TolC family protein [Desulfuromonadales bacterium]